MHHPLKHINQDKTRRKSKDKDSTVNKTEYRSKRIPTGKPRFLQPKMTRNAKSQLQFLQMIILKVDSAYAQ